MVFLNIYTWADSFIASTQASVVRTPGCTGNPTPGKRRLPTVPPTPIRPNQNIDNDQITAIQLLATDLGEITKASATKITNIIARIAAIEQNQKYILSTIYEKQSTCVSSTAVHTPSPTPVTTPVQA